MARRTKPVRREEIRFDGKAILTLPVNSVRESKTFWRGEPIRALWKPLYEKLRRQMLDAWERDAPRRQFVAAAGFGKPSKEPPELHYPYPHRERSCRGCGRAFFSVRHAYSAYCSDVCASKARHAQLAHSNAIRVKARSEARAAARADRTCAQCGAPLIAARSTLRYCSARCRAAAHRQRP